MQRAVAAPIDGGTEHRSNATPSSPRVRFAPPKLLRAGYADFIINHEAIAYMRQRSLAGPVIARLADHPDRHFADHEAWTAHLEKLGITPLQVNPDPVEIATEGAIWGSIKSHGLMTLASLTSANTAYAGCMPSASFTSLTPSPMRTAKPNVRSAD